MTTASTTTTAAKKSVQQEIAELHALDPPGLIARFVELFGRPPRSKQRPWLLRRCAHHIQVARCGRLSEVARKRLGELMAEIDLPPAPSTTTTGTLRRSSGRDGPAIGTTYSRIWHGREVRVTVMHGGFEYEGVVHKSLSAAVRAITGARWNPSIFFGLTKRERAP